MSVFRNFDFLVKSVAIVGVLMVSALMLFVFSSKNSNYFWMKKKNSKESCSSDPVVSSTT